MFGVFLFGKIGISLVLVSLVLETMINISSLAQNALTFAREPDILPNAIINFRTTTATDLTFDDLGNPVFEGVTTERTIKCYLRNYTESLQNQKNIAGIDQLSNRYIGRLVDPKVYDFPIVADGVITVTLNGRIGKLIEIFQIETSSSLALDLPNNLGQKIQCHIEFGNA